MPQDVKNENRLKTTIWLVAGLAFVVVISSLNRKLGLSFQRMKVWDVLRVCDIMTLFVLAPSAIMLAWLLFKTTCIRKSVLLEASVILSIFFLGMAFGMHEPTNALNCTNIQLSSLKKSLTFFDDDLSHWIFFAGFIFFALLIAIAETRDPIENRFSKWILAISIIFGLSVAASIYANMVNEKTGIDIAVLVACSTAVLIAHIRNGWHSLLKLPFTLMIYIGLGGGSLATLLKWGFNSL